MTWGDQQVSGVKQGAVQRQEGGTWNRQVAANVMARTTRPTLEREGQGTDCKVYFIQDASEILSHQKKKVGHRGAQLYSTFITDRNTETTTKWCLKHQSPGLGVQLS